MKKRGLAIASVICTMLGYSAKVEALPTIGADKMTTKRTTLLRTTAGCKPAEAAIDLDINNVRARVMTGGDMWSNKGTNAPSYEVPKGQGKHSLYAGSCWIGGIDGNNQLKVAAQLFRTEGNDYWPGPIDIKTQSIDAATCSEWDRFWKVNSSTIISFRALIASGNTDAVEGNTAYDVIREWPARGNTEAKGANGGVLTAVTDTNEKAYGYAPFVDVDGDGRYNWKNGDYPEIKGDQYIWWVFNDVGNVKLQSKTEAIGMEVQTSAFAYSTKDFMNDATFYNYRLINRGNVVLDSCFIATWTDADLGYPFDDYIGCDTTRGLGVLYNAQTPDGANGVNSYGTRLPMVGVDFFIGPRKDYIDPVTGQPASRLLKMASFSYFENDVSSQVRDPNNGPSLYNYMTGSTYYGLRFSNDQSRGTASVGYGAGPIAPFVFYGDPGNKSEWSQCSCNSPKKDRRFIHSSGPFTLQVGVKNDITIGVVWVDNVGACGTGSFKKIRAADDIAQGLFNNAFKETQGPNAPRLVVRELDRRLIVYMLNDSNSNNFQERYGDTAEQFRVVSTKARDLLKPDSIYKFEGYRVFQLKRPSSQIYNDDGSLNTDEAVEIFQCDKKNGITKIVNFTKNLEVSDSINFYDAVIKVRGKDSGIVHSFEITEDAFASGESDRRLVNYKTYYITAVAYAYNNFAAFDPNDAVNTQDAAYLEGSKAAGGNRIPVDTCMPHPVNDNMYTQLGSSYGQGVVITRWEGSGNGGSDVQLSDSSEASILANNIAPTVTYKKGAAPVEVKVVDPQRVISADWTIKLTGASYADTNRGISDTAGRWQIVNSVDNQVVYSERNLSTPNEQILEKYGLSVEIHQVAPPGVEPTEGNGYITSDVVYANPALSWLSGVQDQSGRSLANWIRSGSFNDVLQGGETAASIPCFPFTDNKGGDGKFSDSLQAYANMFANNSYLKSTWAPYDLVSDKVGEGCGFSPAFNTTPERLFPTSATGAKVYSEIPNVDLVFTSDRSKWTRCVVLETQENTALAEGGAAKLKPRSHRSWNGDIDAGGNPVYASDKNDTGYSYFPGYAINQLTGERLNIVFGEDSYLKRYHGADMLWNPTSIDLNYGYFNQFGEVVFGGKHFTYIANTRYDSCKAFVAGISNPSIFFNIRAYRTLRWTGIPLLNYGYSYLSLKDGLIPTETRLRFRVNTPYKKYIAAGQTPQNDRNPLYTFTTRGMAPVKYSDVINPDLQALLDRIHVVPNPYKGQASGGNGSYENNRLETKVKIINLPQKASVDIYSLDGTLVRHLEKDNDLPYIDWDLYNAAGLPIASGMYIVHVSVYGQSKVIKWFGAMRPLDVTNY